MDIRESIHLTEQVEDWSKVRSPSRARRRIRQGHRQNVVTRIVPRKDAISIDGGRTLLMHPETAREFYRMLDEKGCVERAPLLPSPLLGIGSEVRLGKSGALFTFGAGFGAGMTWGGSMIKMVDVT